jgi:ribosomal peptide maturation radical SAM protein 1
VDNILDVRYLDGLFPLLAETDFGWDFFWEVKSNLTREHIRTLARAGVREVQPGIESMSTRVLRLMRKGVTAIQNINTLRWTLYYGITTHWNLLWGFPGETEDDYQRQADLIPQLLHLQPPATAGRIWMERYSPVFTDRASFPVRYLQPQMSYQYIYPRHVDLDRAAYFFDYEFEGALPDSAYCGILDRIRGWQSAWARPMRPTLTFWSAERFVQIEDTRDPERPGTYTFEDPLAGLYTGCTDRPQSARSLKERLSLAWHVEEIESALEV